MWCISIVARVHHPYWCWTESRPISRRLLAHRFYRYYQQGHHNNISASIAPSLVVPIPPRSPTPPSPAALPTDNNNMSTSEGAGYSGRLRSSTLDDRETGTARSRSRDSRRREPSDEEPEDGPPDHHTDPPTHRNNSPIRAEKEADQPPLDSGAPRTISLQPRGSTTNWPPRARHGTTDATWALRARQSTTLRAPGTGAPMPAPQICHMRRRGPSGRSSGRSTTPKRRLSGVKHTDIGLTKISSRRRPLRGRRPW